MKHYYGMSNKVEDVVSSDIEDNSAETVQNQDSNDIKMKREERKSFTETLNIQDPKEGTVTGVQYLTLREAASGSSKIIGMLKDGDRVTRVKGTLAINGYIKVSVKGTALEGFIPGKYFQSK